MPPKSDKKTILIIEDEPDMVFGLKEAFEFEGYEIKSSLTGEEGVRMAKRLHPDLLIVDLMLPDLNGYLVTKQIRQEDPRVPILILTARSQEGDKVRGFDSGADDYVTKPFSVAELLARVRALFRRAERSIERTVEEIEIGPARINLKTHALTRDKKDHQLSFYELELLKLLDERRGEVVSRDEILDKVWGIEASPTNRTVDNFIVKLRKLIEEQPDKPKHILTIYGQGYKLV